MLTSAARSAAACAGVGRGRGTGVDAFCAGITARGTAGAVVVLAEGPLDVAVDTTAAGATVRRLRVGATSAKKITIVATTPR